MTLYYNLHNGGGDGTSSLHRVPTGPPVRLLASDLKSIYTNRPYVASRTSGNDYYYTVKGARPRVAAESASNSPRGLVSDLLPKPNEDSMKKIVYWDGMEHHIISTPKNSTLSKDWKPPHLHHTDLEDGHILGVRETPGAEKIRLIGSKYRYLPTLEPGSSSACALKTPWDDKCGTGIFGTGSYGPGYTTDYSERRSSSARGSSRSYANATAMSAAGEGAAARPQTAMGGNSANLYQSQSARAMNGVGGWEMSQAKNSSSNGRVITPKVAFQ